MDTGNKESPKEKEDKSHPTLNDELGPTATDRQEEQTQEKDLSVQLEEAINLANQHRDSLLRAQAEVENIRKRSARDIEQARMYAIERFVVEILAVKDSLELGLAPSEQSPEKVKEGAELILKLMDQIFERFDIKEIFPQGDKFDPEKHQAMLTQQNSEYEPGTVFEVLQKGYLLNDRLIRPAMVNVVGEREKPDDSKEMKEIGG